MGKLVKDGVTRSGEEVWSLSRITPAWAAKVSIWFCQGWSVRVVAREEERCRWGRPERFANFYQGTSDCSIGNSQTNRISPVSHFVLTVRVFCRGDTDLVLELVHPPSVPEQSKFTLHWLKVGLLPWEIHNERLLTCPTISSALVNSAS